MKHILIKCTKVDGLSKLLPQVLAEKGYDIIDLFVEENDAMLLNYADALTKEFPKKVTLHTYTQGEEIHGADLIAKKGDYYLVVDENLVFMESGTINALFKKKEENPEYFLVMPLVVNSWLGCYLMQNNPKYTFGGSIRYTYNDSFNGNDYISTNGEEAELVHMAFLETYRKNKKLTSAHCKDFEFCSRVTLDCVCWSGDDMHALLDEYDIFNAEPFFTYQYPISNDKRNLVMGNKIVARYSHPAQEKHLDTTSVKILYFEDFYNRIASNKTLLKAYLKCTDLAETVNKKKVALYTIVGEGEPFVMVDESRIAVDMSKDLGVDDPSLGDIYPYYGTLKGIAWILKQMEASDAEFVGTEMPLAYWNMTEEQINNALFKFDTIMPNSVTNHNICELYSQYHSRVDFELLGGVIKEYFPDYYDTWSEHMYRDGQMGFIRNAVICRKETFIGMWTFVFDVLSKFREVFALNSDDAIKAHVRMFCQKLATPSCGDDWIAYQQRMFEHMSERLVTLYVYKNCPDVGLGDFKVES